MIAFRPLVLTRYNYGKFLRELFKDSPSDVLAHKVLLLGERLKNLLLTE